MRGVVLHCRAATALRRGRRVACMAAPQNPLHALLAADAKGGWHAAWEKRVTPWDAGVSPPVLLRLVREGALPQGRTLVPGVGGGWDALALASPTRPVVGLDLSPTAVQLAAARRDAQDVPAAQCKFVAGDFFEHELGACAFALVWDYTFFCALAPALRPRWAARMAELLAPDGLLVTLIFPVGDFEGGPPFAVSPQLYTQLLGDAGFEAVQLTQLADEDSHAARRGKEWLGVWRLKRGGGGGTPRM